MTLSDVIRCKCQSIAEASVNTHRSTVSDEVNLVKGSVAVPMLDISRYKAAFVIYGPACSNNITHTISKLKEAGFDSTDRVSKSNNRYLSAATNQFDREKGDQTLTALGLLHREYVNHPKV